MERRLGVTALFLLIHIIYGSWLGGSVLAQHRSRADIEKEYFANSMQAVPRDAFPVLTNPPVGSVADGDKLFRPNEWVIGVAINGEARAYPVTVMGVHELINETVGGQPITVCW
jgi:hypothetical protein